MSGRVFPLRNQVLQTEADAEVAYARVGALCEAIKAELNNDLKIHDQGILPQFINLPQVTAGEYCRVRPFDHVSQWHSAAQSSRTCLYIFLESSIISLLKCSSCYFLTAIEEYSMTWA